MPSTETFMWFFTALMNAFTAWVAWRTHTLSTQTALDVHKVEIATNSMKDALVSATASAAHAAGKEEGRVEGEVKAANVAEGKLQGGVSQS